MHTDEKPTVAALRQVTLRLREKLLFQKSTWEVKRRQHWAVLGPNGAGKSTLVRALAGEVAVVGGALETPFLTGGRKAVGYLSFEKHRRLIAREDLRDESRFFSGRWEDITTVGQLFEQNRSAATPKAGALEDLLEFLQLRHLANRGLRFLSTGEIRRVLIAQALMNRPQILILDEPFEGLDSETRTRLALLINRLMNDVTPVLLVTHRLKEILPNITHVLGVRAGCILFQGPRPQVLTTRRIERLYRPRRGRGAPPMPARVGPSAGASAASDDVIFMRNVTVRYDRVTVLEDFNWRVARGENWAVCGPNGCGKSTLLSLVTGDHPQAYANDLQLFGKSRGSGESIWEIKRRIGMMSSEFQIRYRRSIAALDVVMTGFFDSVGLFSHGTAEQRRRALQAMMILGVDALARRRFDRLSTGEQRMVLLARALVKKPTLLVLDEPCQGLDRSNRRLILDTVDFLGRDPRRTLLMVTHHADEIPACMTHMLTFKKSAGAGFDHCCLPLSNGSRPRTNRSNGW
jgi:molybdate transport system ATP-binding protein